MALRITILQFLVDFSELFHFILSYCRCLFPFPVEARCTSNWKRWLLGTICWFKQIAFHFAKGIWFCNSNIVESKYNVIKLISSKNTKENVLCGHLSSRSKYKSHQTNNKRVPRQFVRNWSFSFAYMLIVFSVGSSITDVKSTIIQWPSSNAEMDNSNNLWLLFLLELSWEKGVNMCCLIAWFRLTR